MGFLVRYQHHSHFPPDNNIARSSRVGALAPAIIWLLQKKWKGPKFHLWNTTILFANMAEVLCLSSSLKSLFVNQTMAVSRKHINGTIHSIPLGFRLELLPLSLPLQILENVGLY
jgi:hypothetical protein